MAFEGGIDPLLSRLDMRDQEAILNALLETDPNFEDLITHTDFEGLGAVHGRRNMEETAEGTQSLFMQLTGTDKNFLVYNFLSTNWTWSNIKANPVQLPVAYIFGIIGYLISLPIRIVILVVTFFKMIATFVETVFKGEFSSLRHRMRFTGLIFLGATGELASNIVGLACPPVAYKFDEWIQSHRTIHAWYGANWLSIWSYELEGRVLMPGETGIGGVEGSIGNEHRMELKKERIKDDIEYFKSSRADLEKYIDKDEIAMVMGETLYVIAALGCLKAMIAGKGLGVFRDERIKKCGNEEEGKKVAEKLNKYVARFDTVVKAVVSGSTKSEGLAKVPVFGRFFKKEDSEEKGHNKISAEAFVRAIKYELLLVLGEEAIKSGDKEQINGYFNSLGDGSTGEDTVAAIKKKLKKLEKIPVVVDGKSMNLREAIGVAYKAINQFSHEIVDGDREMMNAVGVLVFRS